MKKSIIFGVLAMFAVSAVSVNAQVPANQKNEPKKETVKDKSQKANPVQSANQNKTKGDANSEGVAPAKPKKGSERVKNDVTNQKADKTGPAMNDVQKPKQKSDAKVQEKNKEPQMKDVQKPKQKSDAKVQEKNKEPQMKDVQKPQVKPENKAEKKNKEPLMKDVQKPKIKNEGKQDKSKVNVDKGTTATKPKQKKEGNTSTTSGKTGDK